MTEREADLIVAELHDIARIANEVNDSLQHLIDDERVAA